MVSNKSDLTPSEMLAKYQSGLSLKEVGAIAGVTKQAVHLVISKLPGYTPRKNTSPTLTMPESELSDWQKWRKNKLLGVELVKCKYCDVTLKSPKTKERKICTHCWEQYGGDAKKAENRAKQRLFKARHQVNKSEVNKQ